MRRTGLLGILLLCTLTAAKPVNAAAADVTSSPFVKSELEAEKDSDDDCSEEKPVSDAIVSDTTNDVQDSVISDLPANPEDDPAPEKDCDIAEVLQPEDTTVNKENPAPENSLEPEEISSSDIKSDTESNEETINATSATVSDSQDSSEMKEKAEEAATSSTADSASNTEVEPPVGTDPTTPEEKIEDRIHFITLNGEYGDSDSFLIESNGLYGLIDSSNPSDHNDRYYDPAANGLLTVVNYLTDLNVDHLRFVLATHSHSDHIGGMPDVANAMYGDNYLVNSDTVYIYKEYEVSEESEWDNSTYFNLALEAMRSRGAALLNVLSPNLETEAKRLLGADLINDTVDSVGTHLSFTMGDFLINLFNLHTESKTNENLNSIITTVQKDESRAVLMADMEMSNYMESRVVDAIIRNDGTSKTDVYKMGHHSYSSSNSLDTINTLKPKYCVQSTKRVYYTPAADTIYNYFIEAYGGSVYRTSENSPSIIADFGENGVSIISKALDGILLPAVPWKAVYTDGFHKYYPDEDSYNNTGIKTIYFKSGTPRKGWFKAGNDWYYANSNYVVQTGWLQDGEKWYLLDNSSGAMKIGWAYSDGNWYYMNSDGSRRSGWLQEKGKWYLLNPNGIMLTGWRMADGKKYYFNSSGVMQTGWIYSDNHWYFLNSSGAMRTGWLYYNGRWYLFDSSGVMLTGWQWADSKRYYFNPSGVMQTSWIYSENNWYFLNNNGALQTGWLKYGSKWYFLDKWNNGAMLTGWQELDRNTYFFTPDGTMVTGWRGIAGNWHFFNSNGALQKGWLKDGGKWYFLDKWNNGIMLTGWQELDNQWYYFNPSGAMQTGWIIRDGKWCYLESSGAMATNKWIGDYYVKSDGSMAVNEWIGSYYVGADGKWIRGYKAAA